MANGPHTNITEQPRDIMNDPVKRKEEFKKLHTWGIKEGFRESAKKVKPVLLEPIMKVLTPDQYMGDVTGDLNRRRGMLEGMDSKFGVQDY